MIQTDLSVTILNTDKGEIMKRFFILVVLIMSVSSIHAGWFSLPKLGIFNRSKPTKSKPKLVNPKPTISPKRPELLRVPVAFPVGKIDGCVAEERVRPEKNIERANRKVVTTMDFYTDSREDQLELKGKIELLKKEMELESKKRKDWDALYSYTLTPKDDLAKSAAIRQKDLNDKMALLKRELALETKKGKRWELMLTPQQKRDYETMMKGPVMEVAPDIVLKEKKRKKTRRTQGPRSTIARSIVKAEPKETQSTINQSLELERLQNAIKSLETLKSEIPQTPSAESVAKEYPKPAVRNDQRDTQQNTQNQILAYLLNQLLIQNMYRNCYRPYMPMVQMRY